MNSFPNPEEPLTRAKKTFPFMAEQRKRAVYLLAAAFVFGHLFDIITWEEHWPFSRYPMYSRLPEMKVLPKLRAFGVVDGRELPLTAEKHFPPFNGSRLSAALARLGSYQDNPQLFDAAVRNLVQLYEGARRRRLHDDPPLEAIRIYQLQWDLDPWARNAQKPDRRNLLVEVKIDGHVS